jgi:hypothetical protein
MSLDRRLSFPASRDADVSPKVLSAEAFAFELDAELRRAVRLRNTLTLMVLEPQASGGEAASTGERLAKLVESRVRESDLVGYTPEGGVSVALLDTDLDCAAHVVGRLASPLEAGLAGAAVRIGAAAYPRHATDAVSLHREARSRRVTARR